MTENLRAIREEFLAHLHAGALFYWRRFEFADGTVRNKWALVLGMEGPQIVLLTLLTSKYKFYERDPHFDTEVVQFEPHVHGPFRKYTYLDLRQIRSISVEVLFDEYRRKKVRYRGDCSEEMKKLIREQIRRSKTLSPMVKEKLSKGFA